MLVKKTSKHKDKIITSTSNNEFCCIYYENGGLSSFELINKDTKAQLYQDFAPVTIERYKQWRQYTQILQEKNIRYAWTFPLN